MPLNLPPPNGHLENYQQIPGLAKIGKWAAWEKEADLKAEEFPGKESGADGIDKKRMPGAGAQRVGCGEGSPHCPGIWPGGTGELLQQ